MQANERYSTGQPVIMTIAGKRGVEQMSSVVAVCVAIAAIALVILMLREGAYLQLGWRRTPEASERRDAEAVHLRVQGGYPRPAFICCPATGMHRLRVLVSSLQRQPDEHLHSERYRRIGEVETDGVQVGSIS